MCLCATQQVGPRGEEGERKAGRIRDGTCQGDEEGKDKYLIKVLKVEVSVPGQAWVNSFLPLLLIALDYQHLTLFSLKHARWNISIQICS